MDRVAPVAAGCSDSLGSQSCWWTRSALGPTWVSSYWARWNKPHVVSAYILARCTYGPPASWIGRPNVRSNASAPPCQPSPPKFNISPPHFASSPCLVLVRDMRLMVRFRKDALSTVHAIANVTLNKAPAHPTKLGKIRNDGVWRSTHKAVHTQGGAHRRRSVAIARVLLFKGGVGAGPCVERSELK